MVIIDAHIHYGDDHADLLSLMQSLDENNPHYGYYSRNPQWRMYEKSEFPSHQRLMDAGERDQSLELLRQTYQTHFAYLERDAELTCASARRTGWACHKIYLRNSTAPTQSVGTQT